MQAIVETLFDVVYLISVIAIGITMIVKSKGNKEYRLFGIMAVVLGAGDSFHLIPRALALCTTGLENFTVALGAGKFITSITMTIFYIILYYVWRIRYQVKGRNEVTAAVYLLSAVRIALCLFPQNAWLSAASPLSWGIYRNIPFALLGLLIIVLFYKSARETNDHEFRNMWLTIVLSFGFYIPVVLWADTIPLVGMLMGRALGGYHPAGGYADDPQDLRVCLDGADWLQVHDEQPQEPLIFLAACRRPDGRRRILYGFQIAINSAQPSGSNALPDGWADMVSPDGKHGGCDSGGIASHAHEGWLNPDWAQETRRLWARQRACWYTPD